MGAWLKLQGGGYINVLNCKVIEPYNQLLVGWGARVDGVEIIAHEAFSTADECSDFIQALITGYDPS